jgi:hypothetical protein
VNSSGSAVKALPTDLRISAFTPATQISKNGERRSHNKISGGVCKRSSAVKALASDLRISAFTPEQRNKMRENHKSAVGVYIPQAAQ